MPSNSIISTSQNWSCHPDLYIPAAAGHVVEYLSLWSVDKPSSMYTRYYYKEFSRKLGRTRCLPWGPWTLRGTSEKHIPLSTEYKNISHAETEVMFRSFHLEQFPYLLPTLTGHQHTYRPLTRIGSQYPRTVFSSVCQLQGDMSLCKRAASSTSRPQSSTSAENHDHDRADLGTGLTTFQFHVNGFKTRVCLSGNE